VSLELPTPTPTPEPEPEGWVRLHPLTPLLRGGRYALAALAVLGQQGLRDSSMFGGWAVAVFAASVLVAVLLGYVSWRAMRYRLTATELQVESGVLTKRSRRVPLAQVEAVDVVRPFYARVLGLAELRLEVVGGGDSEAPLSFLSDNDANRLRSRLLDLASGRTALTDPLERVLGAVPTGALVGSILLGPPLVVGVLLVALAAAAAFVDLRAAGAVLLLAGPGLLAVGSVSVRRFLVDYGSTVAESPDGLRLRSGLLDTRSQTIPSGRIQTVRVAEPLLWRPFGWVRVEVDVAGYSAGDQARSVLLPVAPEQFARQLVARVLDRPIPVPDRPAPARARWLAPLSFRRLAVTVDDWHLVTTGGILTTTTSVVPLAKVQSLRTTQGPWQRRLGLATLHVDSAGRSLPGAIAPHRAAEEAQALLEELAARARLAVRGLAHR